jgi:hypothetical protein
MLAYLAAPYTHKDQSVTRERMRRFHAIDAQLMNQGVFTVSPLLKDTIVVTHGIAGTWDYWKEYSQVLLRRCDKMIVLMFPGWESSVGVQTEIQIAMEFNIPVEFYDDVVGNAPIGAHSQGIYCVDLETKLW